MKLSKSAWHAKLNSFIYGWGYLESVDCLCPYFWGTLLAIILVPLWLVGHGINRVIEAIPECNWTFPSIDMSYKTKQIISKVIGYTLLFVVATALVICFGLAIEQHGVIHVLFWIGVGAGFVGACIGAVFGLYWIKEKYDDWREDHPKEKKPNLLVEMFKAKKNKHCPLVQWTDD